MDPYGEERQKLESCAMTMTNQEVKERDERMILAFGSICMHICYVSPGAYQHVLMEARSGDMEAAERYFQLGQLRTSSHGNPSKCEQKKTNCLGNAWLNTQNILGSNMFAHVICHLVWKHLSFDSVNRSSS